MKKYWFGFAILWTLINFPQAQAAKIFDAVTHEFSKNSLVRVIVRFKHKARSDSSDSTKMREIAALGASVIEQVDAIEVNRQFSLVPAIAMTINAEDLAILKQHPLVEDIDLDVPGFGSMVQSAPLANMSPLYAQGLNAAGIKIAIVDSGIDTDHADFSGRIVAQQCFCAGVAGAVGCCPNGTDTQTGVGAAEDDHGHGTNVSGIAAGNGTVAQRGGASAANIVSVKVLDSNNSFCCSSDVIAALDWVRTNHSDTKVLNASLGTGSLFSGFCDAAGGFATAMSTAVSNLVNNGTMVTVSSGNQGNATQISAPACANAATAVGAVWDANLSSQTFLGCTQTPSVDLATCFTNSSNAVDLYAPGAFVTSSGFSGGTSTFGGTSQATPLVAGCAAIMRAQFPLLSVAQIEAVLRESPNQITDPKNGLQFARLNCADAYSRLNSSLFANGFE